MPRTPTWNPRAPEVPVDKDGNWLHYPDWKFDHWEPVDPFYARLIVDDMYAGRSAKGVILKNDTTMVKYPMFITDMVKALQHHELHASGGSLAGFWAATKKGANYGIRFVGATDPSGEL